MITGKEERSEVILSFLALSNPKQDDKRCQEKFDPIPNKMTQGAKKSLKIPQE